MREEPLDANATMNCVGFGRWLDQGAPPALEAPCRAHAASCPRCARALAAQNELNAALAEFAAPPPPALAARVMARIAQTPQRSPEAMIEPVLEWWVRAAAEPSTALAGVLAALLIWRAEAFVRFLTALARVTLSGASAALDLMPRIATPAWLAAPGVGLALTMAALPAVLWASFTLYSWLERAFVPGAVPVGLRASLTH